MPVAAGMTGTNMARRRTPPPATAANDRMHAVMAPPFPGDADVDFIRGRLPRHDGAVEKARIARDHGTDPEPARALIAARQAQIPRMRDRLADRDR